MVKGLFIIYILMNVIAFALMGIDKRKAIKGAERIPEKVLLIPGFALGGIGLLLGALIWHHKTRKWKFRLGIPAAILVNILIMGLLLSSAVAADASRDIVFKCEGTSEISQDAIDKLNEGDYQCALILGCAVYADGSPTPMLRDRLDVGISLYKAGVVPKLLLSGDHGQVEYNEIGTMYNYCLEAGVPEEDIFLDHAGFSTYDSMYRAQSIFCVERMIVVTQTYHEFRALHIAKALGINACGVSSDQFHYRGAVYREFREILARSKDYFKTKVHALPTYGGEQIPITGPADKSHE